MILANMKDPRYHRQRQKDRKEDETFILAHRRKYHENETQEEYQQDLLPEAISSRVARNIRTYSLRQRARGNLLDRLDGLSD